MLNAPFTSALTSRGLLSCPLKMKNYSHRFHLLLHLEEIQMEVDIRKYDLLNQTMTQDQGNRKLLKLRVKRFELEHRLLRSVFAVALLLLEQLASLKH